jgi:hypothetical protein
MFHVLSFAFSHSDSILIALARSIDSPEATKLAIQSLTILMRIHKNFRAKYAQSTLFIEWRTNPRNPLYSPTSVEGLLIVYDSPDRDDLYLSEVQQFIFYIGEERWPLPDELPPRVVNRFKAIWTTKSRDKPILPFPDPGERWDTDEDEESDSDFVEPEDGELTYSDFLNDGELYDMNVNGDEDRETIDFIEEPDPLTPEDLVAYFQAAEEAGLRSQDRRRGRRRELEPTREDGEIFSG